jgi:hypothetical protein
MSFPLVPKTWGGVGGPIAEWARKLAEAIEQLAAGTSKTVSSVTLDANATSTTVTNVYVTPSSHITLEPTTANAATEKAAGTMYVSTRTNGTSFVITHANSSQTDRTFTFQISNP